jgi:hypothetical protein
MYIDIDIYPDYVIIENQRVNSPSGVSVSRWMNKWERAANTLRNKR